MNHGRERIKAIQVYQPDESIHVWDDLRFYLRIIAEKPVDAEGFKITEGEVPDGFIQVIPSPEIIFQPTPGKILYCRKTCPYISISLGKNRMDCATNKMYQLKKHNEPNRQR